MQKYLDKNIQAEVDYMRKPVNVEKTFTADNRVIQDIVNRALVNITNEIKSSDEYASLNKDKQNELIKNVLSKLLMKQNIKDEIKYFD